MTKEVARIFLLQLHTDKQLNKSEHEALRVAIKALEQESAEIHEGDVRANIEGDYYMIIEEQKENSKIMHIDGSFEWLDNYNIITDEDAGLTMEEFLKIVMKDK